MGVVKERSSLYWLRHIHVEGPLKVIGGRRQNLFLSYFTDFINPREFLVVHMEKGEEYVENPMRFIVIEKQISPISPTRAAAPACNPIKCKRFIASFFFLTIRGNYGRVQHI